MRQLQSIRPYFFSYLRVNMKIPLPLAKVEITLLSNWEADTNDMAYVQTSPKADFSVTSELLAVAIVENTTLVFEPVTPFSQNNYMRIIFLLKVPLVKSQVV